MTEVLFRDPELVLETVDHEPPKRATPLRYPTPDETPLSRSEVWHGMRHGLITNGLQTRCMLLTLTKPYVSDAPAHARAFGERPLTLADGRGA
ncbi:hypothetical protein [Variovorax paradoxus]|uniref:hypothetical protein n=1 Tax=Variovorax paradoxus TaxID=34073 RepID=UPI001931EE3A|nr:hypothetical protein INQ48_18120 [Variovorax paradoxus]